MRFRCRICGSELTIYANKPWEQSWPDGHSPYDNQYGHLSMRDCPFHQGLEIEQLRNHLLVESVD